MVRLHDRSSTSEDSHDVAEKILLLLNDSAVASLDSTDIADRLHVDHQTVVGAVKSLETLGNIKTEPTSRHQWQLTSEGAEVAERGSHEAVLYRHVPATGINQTELMKTVPNAKIGFSKALAAGWIKIEKQANGPLVFPKVDKIEDSVQETLLRFREGNADKVPDEQKTEFKKRKLVTEVVVKSFLVSKGDNFSTSVTKPETDLTNEMLVSGSWKTKKFKQYNFNALGVLPTGGHFHPLLKVRAEYRQIFLEMGFTEMPTNNYVESSFWNFDALFQPQHHPARDAHDTFFISDPKEATAFPLDYLERVKSVHSVGGYGSKGYQYNWDIEEAKKNLLRTHTTAVSTRMLYQAAQEKPFKPVKYFSIDRVFRNESLDATHLAEFHQIEGVVADRGLGLGHLIGILYEFFRKLGIEKLRFKPAYNPYTEPSMEIFSYHDGLKKWIELGNSGLFRPEMLLPMGLPEDVSVIAWGLSLERPTMIKYGIDNIRDLIGPRVNLRMVYENPICRL